MENIEINTPSTLYLHEVARRLRVSSRIVRREIARGRLRAIKAGNRWIVSSQALAEYLERDDSGKPH